MFTHSDNSVALISIGRAVPLHCKVLTGTHVGTSDCIDIQLMFWPEYLLSIPYSDLNFKWCFCTSRSCSKSTWHLEQTNRSALWGFCRAALGSFSTTLNSFFPSSQAVQSRKSVWTMLKRIEMYPYHFLCSNSIWDWQLKALSCLEDGLESSRTVLNLCRLCVWIPYSLKSVHSDLKTEAQ